MDDYQYQKYYETMKKYYEENPQYNGECDCERNRLVEEATKWRVTHSYDDYSDGGF